MNGTRWLSQTAARRSLGAWIALVAVLACAVSARAERIDELARVSGLDGTTLVGWGIVTGLNGTGDTFDRRASDVAAPYAQLLANLGIDLDAASLAQSQSFALVRVSVELPAHGVSEGTQLDATITTLYNATSLAGGSLSPTFVFVPLLERAPDGERPDLGTEIAVVAGDVPLLPESPTRARIRSGAQLLQNVTPDPVIRRGDEWWIDLVVREPYAGPGTATAIADAVNQEYAAEARVLEIAEAVSFNVVRVRLPLAERARPVHFVAMVLGFHVDAGMLRRAPVVRVSRSKQLIAVEGDVRVKPAVVTVAGLQLTTVEPPPVPTAGNPVVRTDSFVPVGTEPTSERLALLLDALNRLRVPTLRQIDVIVALHDAGLLLGRLEYEE